jgi:predicted permease
MNGLISMGEIRLALRLIVKQPILSATVILALAVGICLATMGFTLRDEVINATLPYQAGDRFIRINLVTPASRRLDPAIDVYHAFRDRATSVEHVGAASGRPFTVTHDSGEIESITGALITPRSMAWVEAVPLIGRTLIEADGEPGAEAVVVIRDSLWRRRFSGDAGILGRSLIVGAQPRTIVGVMPDTFQFHNSGELWMPLDEATLGGSARGVFAVLRPGETYETAAAELDQIFRSVPRPETPDTDARVLVRSFTGEGDEAGVAASSLVFVLVMVLMVVASNVATLIFARTWSRAPELAVRTALGAPRTRVVGQLFAEVLLLASMAAVVGLAAAYGALRYLRAAFEGIPFWVTLEPNPRVIVFVVALTALVSAVSGLLPALRVTRHDLRNTLQNGRGFAAGGFGRVGAVLLVVEIALSVALLNGAVTMARAFTSFVEDIPAVPADQVLTAQLGRIREPEQRDKVVAAARALPGVLAAGAGQNLPRLYPPPRMTAVEPMPGEPTMAPQPAPGHAVGEGFLEAIGGRPVLGRVFTRNDFSAGAAPVVVVNEPFVAKFLGGRNPIGRRLRLEERRTDAASPRSEEPWREIVGVVPDLGLSVGDPALTAGFYIPVRTEMLWFLAIRTSGDPRTQVAPLRAAVAKVDPDLQLQEVRTLEEAGYEERVFLSAVATALTAMGGMALALSIVGIYALLSFMVTRRTREIGIRMALGARSWQVLRSITGGATGYLAIGGLLGTGLGILFAQARMVILISIPAPGFWMPATIFLTLAIAGLTACWLPARRALGIRPSEALNAD